MDVCANVKNWIHPDDEPNGGCTSSAGLTGTPHPPSVIILWEATELLDRQRPPLFSRNRL
eukprot:scaffold1151_cov79-Cyclotella_meneghiniana.AAC.2